MKIARSYIIIFLIASILLFSCTPAEADMTLEAAQELGERLIESGIFSEEMEMLGENSVGVIFPFLNDAEYIQSYCGISGVTADEILIVLAPDAEALDTYYNEMQSYLTGRTTQFAGYAPQEVPKLEDALLIKDGLFLIFCASTDCERAADIVKDTKAEYVK